MINKKKNISILYIVPLPIPQYENRRVAVGGLVPGTRPHARATVCHPAIARRPSRRRSQAAWRAWRSVGAVGWRVASEGRF